MGTLKERFDKKYEVVTESGCWLWTASTFNTGYGRFGKNVDGKWKTGSAHRASYTIHKGDIPKGMYVCHRCDVKTCVNPDHLFLGNNQDNMSDMINKGRSLTGSKNPNSKLSEKEVKEISVLLEQGVYQKDIAKRYNIVQSTVSVIKLGDHWGLKNEEHTNNQ